MMNAVAIALLLSYFGSVVFLVPESPVTRADVGQDGAVLQSVKQVAQKFICDHEPCSHPDSSQSISAGVADVLRETADATEDTIRQKISDIRDSAGERILPAGRDAAEKTGLTHDVDQRTRDIAEGASQAAHSLSERAGFGAQELSSKVKKAGSDAAETLQSMGERAKDAAKGAMDIAGEAGDTAKGAVGKLQEKAMDMAEEAGIGKVREKAREVQEMAKGMTEEVQEMAKGMAGGVQERAKGMTEEVQEMAKGMAGDVNEWAKEMAGDAKGKVQEMAGDAQGKLQEMAGKVQEMAEGAARKGQDMAGEVQGRVKQGFKITKREVDVDGDGGLVVKVQELCSWMGSSDGGERTSETTTRTEEAVVVDVGALQESYAHLMKSAMAAIAKSREVFEKASSSRGGGGASDWRENYLYLAHSAEAALKAAEEMFGRASTAAASSAHPHSLRQTLNRTLAQSRLWLAKLDPLLRSIYLAAFSATFGISMWMTFLSGHILSRVLPRQHLGISQKRLSTVYLWLSAGGLLSCAAIHAWRHPWIAAAAGEKWQYLNLATGVACAMINAMVAEPRMTKAMQRRLKLEKEEGRGGAAVGGAMDEAAMKAFQEVDGRLRRWHRAASAVNLVMLGGQVSHLWYLANRLVV